MKQKNLFWIILICVIVMLITCLYQIHEAEYALVTQFGRPIIKKLTFDPGLHYKLPWPFQVVQRFDKRIQIYQTPLIEYLTGDKKNIVLQAFVCWKIVDPLEFFRAIRSIDSATQKLDDIICSSIGASLGDYKMSNLVSTNAEEITVSKMEEIICTRATNKIKQSYGISIVKIGISRIALPEDNAKSVYRRMIAERSSIANEYRALGKEEADKIKSQADREKSDLLAEAYKQAQIIKGEGEAESARIYASAYEEAPEFFKLLRILEAYKKILDSKTTLVLSSDSELLHYLNGKELK
ncbi:MAG: HflC protein [Candidatus Schekmanbacteria bacterium RBG_13_48_7]|uniref:Protein HflC n=1 Tax=Candidatus Schekmanbacteria bacterium RBG_13_48_7 TaxID=1817878 RepID=A0A1F7S0B8_9BACT|nr:MAG: HflC protein [Candidatus Schekmanbacteria bacterium RBG_13_48_7]